MGVGGGQGGGEERGWIWLDGSKGSPSVVSDFFVDSLCGSVLARARDDANENGVWTVGGSRWPDVREDDLRSRSPRHVYNLTLDTFLDGSTGQPSTTTTTTTTTTSTPPTALPPLHPDRARRSSRPGRTDGWNRDRDWLSSESSADDSSEDDSGAPNEAPAPAIFGKRPPWQPDHIAPVCNGCSKSFGLLGRKHHCRACGRVFCDPCTDTKVALPPALDYKTPQRVCRQCRSALRSAGYAMDVNEEERLFKLAIEQSKATTRGGGGGGGGRRGSSAGGRGGRSSSSSSLAPPLPPPLPGSRTLKVVPLEVRRRSAGGTAKLLFDFGIAGDARSATGFRRVAFEGESSTRITVPLNAPLAPEANSEVDELEQSAVASVRRGRVRDASAMLWDALRLSPWSATLWYNLACAEALDGAVEQAAQHLRQAFECGYLVTHGWSHVRRDRDLEPLRAAGLYDDIDDRYAQVAPSAPRDGRAAPPVIVRVGTKSGLSQRTLGTALVDLSFLGGADPRDELYAEGWYRCEPEEGASDDGIEVKLGLSIAEERL